MKRTIITILCMSWIVLSCSKSDVKQDVDLADKEQVIDNFVSTLDDAQLISLILIENNFNYNKVSEVLNCSAFVLKRIANRESKLTSKTQEFLQEVVVHLLSQKEKSKYFDKKNYIQDLLVKRLGIDYLASKKFDSYETIIDEKWEDIEEYYGM